MGLERRRTSGKSINGSTMIVPGQPVSSYKKFEITFQYKKGSSQELVREYNTTPEPTPEPTPTPETLIDPILTQNNEYINVGINLYLKFVDPPQVNPINLNIYI